MSTSDARSSRAAFRSEDAFLRPALVVIGAGVAAALHVGKLPPTIAALQASLGLTLVQAGFLLPTVQAAGLAFGVAFGVLADGLGLRRSMVLGLALLAGPLAIGAFGWPAWWWALAAVSAAAVVLAREVPASVDAFAAPPSSARSGWAVR